MTECESLWQKLLLHLERERLLAIHSVALTPAEIARQVAAARGDMRVHRFVWHYYYPRVYGKEKGSMTDKQARALVASFHKPPSKKDVRPIEAPQLEPCRICGIRRPARDVG